LKIDALMKKEESYQRLEFNGRDTGGRAHYIIADPDEVVSFVLSLRPPDP